MFNYFKRHKWRFDPFFTVQPAMRDALRSCLGRRFGSRFRPAHQMRRQRIVQEGGEVHIGHPT